MSSLRRIVSIFALFCFSSASAFAADKQIIELKKTDTYFSIGVHFEKCDKPAEFIVQDGAMNTITYGKNAPVRFIVKKNREGVVNYHSVTSEDFVFEGKKVPGLKIQAGMSAGSVPTSVFTMMGVKSLKILELHFGALSKKVPQSKKSDGTVSLLNDPPYTPEPTQPIERCCSFAGCGGDGGMFCTTGTAGCGGDGCGSCCISKK